MREKLRKEDQGAGEGGQKRTKESERKVMKGRKNRETKTEHEIESELMLDVEN